MMVRRTGFALGLGLGLSGILASAGAAEAASRCPADQIVFRDRARGQTFSAERVAVDHKLLCKGKMVARAPSGAQPGDCRGPYGTMVIEGFLNGEKVYAVHSVIAAVPCCSWDSYSGGSPFARAPKKWVTGSKVPKIELGSELFTIEATPPNELTGPLGGGRFVPESCRG
ncbi:hypothetical protein GCM10019059_42750 [Camelimonas fluminis]|nr:hypothetical protein GCM10019059_42750 [Camelimonas fluminis]